MKAWMLALSFVAVLGFSSLADAKGAKHDKGIKGTITAINGATFTMTAKPSKKNPNAAGQTYTVNTSSATITGGTLAVGQTVSVAGSQSVSQANGQTLTTITAATVKIVGHSKKKPT